MEVLHFEVKPYFSDESYTTIVCPDNQFNELVRLKYRTGGRGGGCNYIRTILSGVQSGPSVTSVEVDKN